jgi:hypothetical protein
MHRGSLGCQVFVPPRQALLGDSICDGFFWAGCYVGLEPKLKAERVEGHPQILVFFCFPFSGNFDYGIHQRWTKSSRGLSFLLGLLTTNGTTSENVHGK